MLAQQQRGACMESNHRLNTQLLLEGWALWRYYQSGEVKGYPREVPFYRLMRGASVSGSILTDEQAQRVDAAVGRLSARCPDQGQCIRLRYLDGKSLRFIATALDVPKTRAEDLLKSGVLAVEWILDCTETE